jgi:hypothetical protein
METEIWFPNYGNNPGIVSKLLREEINSIIDNFDAEALEGYYEDFEKFIIKYHIQDEGYSAYVVSSIKSYLGGYYQLDQLSKGQIVKGRLRHPGKVGFGIFVDIGLIHENKKLEVLLPLYRLKQQLEHDISCRKIIKLYGFVDGFPLEVEITEINTQGNNPQISVQISNKQLERIFEWLSVGKDRLIVTKTLTHEVEKAVNKTNLNRSIDQIESIDPLTSMIICNDRTNGSGIIGRLGQNLLRSPIGICSPKRIEEFR